MLLGVCLRVSWICLFFCLGKSFPTDHGNNPMSLSFGSSAVPDPETAASSAGNESASSIKAAVESSDSNATSAPDLLSPRAFYVGPHFHLGEKSPGFSKPQLISSPGGFHSSSNPWFGPPLFQKAVYTSIDSDLYTYGDDSMRYPYYSNDGVHAAALPNGYSYGTARSPYYSYSYGTGGSPQAYDRRVPIAPPYGVGPPPAYGYFSRQPSILDPELLLIGNILMRVREMPLARPWMTSEVPVGLTEKPLYPSSLMQSYRGYHQARDLLSNSQYAKDDLEPVPEPETLETQQFVPETGV
ncbi:hypothetical protein ILYODFUR_034748 [Ilyodon furcidens]|uniref:Uncharacterized protein n=1 Tax=Ilyodon furcidens TaxID=33524 RepID=A0ABV0UBA3_9TELE